MKPSFWGEFFNVEATFWHVDLKREASWPHLKRLGLPYGNSLKWPSHDSQRKMGSRDQPTTNASRWKTHLAISNHSESIWIPNSTIGNPNITSAKTTMGIPNLQLIPPNHPIFKRFSIINHPFWGSPIFGNTRIFQVSGKHTPLLSHWNFPILRHRLTSRTGQQPTSWL